MGLTHKFLVSSVLEPDIYVFTLNQQFELDQTERFNDIAFTSNKLHTAL